MIFMPDTLWYPIKSRADNIRHGFWYPVEKHPPLSTFLFVTILPRWQTTSSHWNEAKCSMFFLSLSIGGSCVCLQGAERRDSYLQCSVHLFISGKTVHIFEFIVFASMTSFFYKNHIRFDEKLSDSMAITLHNITSSITLASQCIFYAGGSK